MIGIGRPAPASDEPQVLLRECHERIRFFTGLARRLADTEDRPESQVADAAGRVRRYFSEALPLHRDDEDESLAPRLRGRDPIVDAALVAMTAEHGEMHGDLTALVGIAEELARAPGRLTELRVELHRVMDRLEPAWERHLAGEEQVVFPAMESLLAPDERACVRAEMRARRGIVPVPP